MDKNQEQSLFKQILDYWFIPSGWDRHTSSSQEANKRHFNGGAEVDQYCREHFLPSLEAIGKGLLEHWKEDHYGRLAYILCTDQFSRNIFRKSSRAFEFDNLALALAREIVDNKKMLNSYKYFERQFIILPFMHSESVADQEKCMELYQEQADLAKEENLPEVEKAFLNYKNYGKLHLDAIAKFGRFPSRNIFLNRESTKEELEYIQNGGIW